MADHYSAPSARRHEISRRPRYSLPELGQLNSVVRRSSLQDRSSKRGDTLTASRDTVRETLREEVTRTEGNKMYIVVKYADNRSLIVNPMCSVVNLLSSIKSRTGHDGQKEMLIDLSDETGDGPQGLIQDLEVHGREYATKYLSSSGTYILMKKELEDSGTSASAVAVQSYKYIPLLHDISAVYPNFHIHLSEAQRKKLKPHSKVNKVPSPAGKMGTTKGGAVNQASRSYAGRPPRSGSRGRTSLKP